MQINKLAAFLPTSMPKLSAWPIDKKNGSPLHVRIHVDWRPSCSENVAKLVTGNFSYMYYYFGILCRIIFCFKIIHKINTFYVQ